MRNLLSASFFRLQKEKAFWIGMALMFGFGLYAAVRRYMGAPDSGPDQMFFLFPVVLSLLLAVFCGWFIGTDYSDGTVRNKLIVGHTRSAVYLCNLIACSVAALLMSLSYLLAVAALGFPLLGLIQMDTKLFVILILISLATVIVYASLFTLLGVSIQNKALSLVACMVALVILFILAVSVNARLEEPEFHQTFSFTEANGNSIFDSVPNPGYLRGTARDLYQLFLDFLPTGQAIQLSNLSAMNLWQMALYSSLIIIASTGCGLLLFQRKDIR